MTTASKAASTSAATSSRTSSGSSAPSCPSTTPTPAPSTYGGGTRQGLQAHRKPDWNYQVKLTAQPVKNLRLTACVVNNFYKYKGDLDTASGGNPNPTVSSDDFGFTYPNFSGSATADCTVGNNFMLSVRGGYFMTNQNKPLVGPATIPATAS